jgi:hypothetical protein
MPQPRDGATVEIVVQLAPSADPAGAGDALRVAATDSGVALRALHPGSTDPELAGWAHATVPAAEADEAVARLSAAPGVAAAYVKPPGTTP